MAPHADDDHAVEGGNRLPVAAAVEAVTGGFPAGGWDVKKLRTGLPRKFLQATGLSRKVVEQEGSQSAPIETPPLR